MNFSPASRPTQARNNEMPIPLIIRFALVV